MRGAGARRGDRAGEAVLDRPMQVAAEHALDLRMARDHGSERLGSLEADPVHMSDQRWKRRMVHDDDGRLRRFPGEGAIEPGEARVIELAAALARNHRIDGDDAYRPLVDRVLDIRLPLTE